MLRTIIFGVVGFAAGFGLATFLTKTKYEDMANEEIQAMRDYVKKKTGEEPEGKDKKAQVEKHKEDMKKFEEERINYATASERGKEVAFVSDADRMKPYRIPEEDFVVDDEEFDKVSLEYYTESELLYEGDEVVSNVEETVGQDCLNLLHGFDDDTIYVRNEKFNIDYEVIKVNGTGPER